MSYTNRALGYQKWGVTNPWVWANYGQPQRRRGYVSPMAFQTAPPHLRSAHLGAASEVEQQLLEKAQEDLERGRRMERWAMVGVTISALSAFMMYNRLYGKKRVQRNRRRRRRRRRTSR